MADNKSKITNFVVIVALVGMAFLAHSLGKKHQAAVHVTEKNKLDITIDSLSRENNGLQKKGDEQENTIAIQERQLSEKDTLIKTKSDSLKTLEETLSDLQKEMDSLQTKAKYDSTEIVRLEILNRNLKTKEGELKLEHAEQLTKINRKIEAQEERSRTIIDSLTKKNQRLKAELEEFEKAESLPGFFEAISDWWDKKDHPPSPNESQYVANVKRTSKYSFKAPRQDLKFAKRNRALKRTRGFAICNGVILLVIALPCGWLLGIGICLMVSLLVK